MIHIYDSMAQAKVPFEKDQNQPIGMYVCGPTVYDFAHLGHGRSAVAFDLIRRYFEFSGYGVDFVFNNTDIDDKMIKRAKRETITVAELAARIIPEYKSDYEALKVKPPTHNPMATDYIAEMIEIIEVLEAKGHSYVLEDGVYFDIKSFDEYGKLSHQKLDDLNAGARVEQREDKRNHQDFVLWKFKKDGEPFWSSPWGEGRPGWHIECSAMSASLLGKSFDIHGGGLDLKFPHHECEIAQSESANGCYFAKHWMHNGYITVNEEKMSKSLGNFFILKDIFKKFHPRVVRFFLIRTHYRSPIEFSEELLEQARTTLKGLDDNFLKSTDDSVDEAMVQLVREKMNNDFDIAGALGELFEWMNGNPNSVRGTLKKLNEFMQIFPVDFKLSEEQNKMIEERNEARKNKDWERSDAIRDELAAQGIELEDGPTACFAKPKI